MHEGRFIKLKEGAASLIDGVSENLWSTEGMLCSMEALLLYEPDTSPGGTTFTFQGDFDLAEVDLEMTYDMRVHHPRPFHHQWKSGDIERGPSRCLWGPH